jgi:hypothetical protein
LLFFAKAVGVDLDIRFAVEILFLTVRAHLAFKTRNRYDPGSNSRTESFAHAPDTPAAAARAAPKTWSIHVDRLADTRMSM